MKEPMKRWVWGLAGAVGVASITLAALAMACRSDEHGLADTTGAPEGSPRTVATEAVEAIADYIGSNGLDGERLELAQPVDCAQKEDEQANEGKVCLFLQDSEIGEDAAEIRAQLVDTTVSWTLSLRRQNGSWLVTDVASAASKQEGAS